MTKKCNSQKFYNADYIKYVNSVAPKTNHGRSLLHAFLVGGFICVIGQFIRYTLLYLFGFYGDELAGATSVVLIFIGCLLTGLGVYDNIGHFAGGGSIVPITGFANSVCSPAMEFRSEGFVYGLASKMFVVAGPIIVYGISASVLVGIIYYVIGLF